MIIQSFGYPRFTPRRSRACLIRVRDTIFTSALFKEPRDRVSVDSFSEKRRSRRSRRVLIVARAFASAKRASRVRHSLTLLLCPSVYESVLPEKRCSPFLLAVTFNREEDADREAWPSYSELGRIFSLYASLCSREQNWNGIFHSSPAFSVREPLRGLPWAHGLLCRGILQQLARKAPAYPEHMA